MRNSLWIILILLLGQGGGTARADTLTLDVSATLTPTYTGGLEGSCASSGCTLSGTVVINNTTGAVESVDVTMSGESPAVDALDEDPATSLVSVGGIFGYVDITADDSSDNWSLALVLPVEYNLIGYDGGSLEPGYSGVVTLTGSGYEWGVTTGSLTAVTTTIPEPSSANLMLIGLGSLGLMLVLRKRIARGLPQAT